VLAVFPSPQVLLQDDASSRRRTLGFVLEDDGARLFPP
jgi:hypothetical protein